MSATPERDSEAVCASIPLRHDRPKVTSRPQRFNRPNQEKDSMVFPATDRSSWTAIGSPRPRLEQRDTK